MDADELSTRQAFDAMALFVREFYDRAGNDLPTLMADINWEHDIEGNEVTLDPAAWDDWLRCVRSILGEDRRP